MLRIANATNNDERCLRRECFVRDSRHSDFIRRFGLYFVTAFTFFYTLPSPVFADPLKQPTNLTEFVNNFLSILNGNGTIMSGVITFVVGFCLFGMMTGIIKYAGAGGDEERLGKAKQLIVYGLLGTFIALSFWGLATLLTRTYFGSAPYQLNTFK